MHGVGPRVGVVEPVLDRVAEERLDLRADVAGRRGPGLIRTVPDVGNGGDALDDGPEPFLGLRCSGVGVPDRGDVGDHALREGRSPVRRRLHVAGFVVDPADVSRLRHDAVLVEELGLFAAVGTRRGRQQPLEIVGMHGVDPHLVLGPLVGAVAEDPLDLRADVEVTMAERVPGVGHRGRFLHERAEAGLRAHPQTGLAPGLLPPADGIGAEGDDHEARDDRDLIHLVGSQDGELQAVVGVDEQTHGEQDGGGDGDDQEVAETARPSGPAAGVALVLHLIRSIGPFGRPLYRVGRGCLEPGWGSVRGPFGVRVTRARGPASLGRCGRARAP